MISITKQVMFEHIEKIRKTDKQLKPVSLF